MYRLANYGEMIADRGRTQAYSHALQLTVGSQSVVLDIGTGTGIWSLLACHFGARLVYAIEPSEVIHLASRVARLNGLESRIQFIQALSTETELPESVDVIVSDIRGCLPLYESSLYAIKDSRERFLKPGGTLIPKQDTLWAAVVEAPDAHRELIEPWSSNPFGFDLTPCVSAVVNAWYNKPLGRSTAKDLVTEPFCWASIDYYTFTDLSVRGEARWTVPEARTGHGLCLWFDTELADGIGFSNSPLSGEQHVYSRGYFPWPEPVQLEPGDRVTAELRADYVASAYIWTWRTRIQSDAGTEKASFNQSTFYSMPLASDLLRKCADTFRPRLNRQGEIDRFILDRMASGLPLGEIATELCAKFPKQFKTWHAALTRAGELSAKYSE